VVFLAKKKIPKEVTKTATIGTIVLLAGTAEGDLQL
jgi:hypothetical protein